MLLVAPYERMEPVLAIASAMTGQIPGMRPAEQGSVGSPPACVP